jgi:outer membrane protein OmpA-like peptidoglycan-associated protein
MPKLKTGPKIVLIVFFALGAVFGIRKAMESGLIPTPGVVNALVPQKAVLPELKDAQVQNVTPSPLPLNGDADVQSVLIKGAIWEWNAQMGLIFANGGNKTARGSLMEKHGVNLELHRQDDTVKMQEELIACAKELKDGASQCSSGANFVIIMGDGAGQFAAAVNQHLLQLGNDFKVKVIGAVGYSRGEDCMMAPPEVKRNPQAAKGLLCAGVLRDGDWDIALKFAGDNNIKNNPDEKTYDPSAINWVSTQTYISAAEDYVAEKCEDRKVVKDGRLTGETKHICVNCVVTWTPGDVIVAQQKGGLVKVADSKMYRAQMPSVILGPKYFFEKNRQEIQHMLAAIFEGSDQVKAFDQALRKAAEISAKVYNDQDAAYWYKYYKGTVEKDRRGLMVELGGSSVNNLADNLILFGLAPGSNNNFRATYTTFANIVQQQYPDLFKDTPIPEAKEIEDKSFVTGAQAVMDDVGAIADTPTFKQVDLASARTVSNRSYSINFETNKDTLTREGMLQLEQLKDGLAITQLYIKIVGHTDSQGDELTVNQPLSVARAIAVQRYLQQRAPNDFPDSRFSVTGVGSSKPVQSNATPAGRAANRRVEISLLDS